MKLHAGFSERFAEEVRVESARQRCRNSEIATVISVSPHTAGRKLNGRVPFNAVEMALIAQTLGLTVTELAARAEASLLSESGAASAESEAAA